MVLAGFGQASTTRANDSHASIFVDHLRVSVNACGAQESYIIRR